MYYTGNLQFNLMNSSGNLKNIFGQIEDHRSHINQLHNLIDILSYWNNFSDLWGSTTKLSRIPKPIIKNE